MPRKHYNPKTKKMATCRAKTQESCPLKDEAGNPAPHFANEEDAKIGYEHIMAEQNDPHSSLSKFSPMEQALSVLPPDARESWKRSFAFYNVTNTVDPETLEKLAMFHYARNSIVGGELEQKFYLSKLRDEIAASDYGKHWVGHDKYRSVNQGIRNEYLSENPMPSNLSEMMPNEPEEEHRLEYAQQSLDFVKKLTPTEHNTMTYWSVSGSFIMGSLVYNPKKPTYGMQAADPNGKGYYDPEPFLKTMDEALQKAKLDEPKELYRGLNEEIVPEEVHKEITYHKLLKEGQSGYDTETNKWLTENYPVGSEIEFKVPCSTTSDRRVASHFSYGVTFRIKAHRAGALGVVGSWGLEESEYLIPRDTRYKVIGTTYGEYDNELVIELEQL